MAYPKRIFDIQTKINNSDLNCAECRILHDIIDSLNRNFWNPVSLPISHFTQKKGLKKKKSFLKYRRNLIEKGWINCKKGYKSSDGDSGTSAIYSLGIRLEPGHLLQPGDDNSLVTFCDQPPGHLLRPIYKTNKNPEFSIKTEMTLGAVKDIKGDLDIAREGSITDSTEEAAKVISVIDKRNELNELTLNDINTEEAAKVISVIDKRNESNEFTLNDINTETVPKVISVNDKRKELNELTLDNINTETAAKVISVNDRNKIKELSALNCEAGGLNPAVRSLILKKFETLSVEDVIASVALSGIKEQSVQEIWKSISSPIINRSASVMALGEMWDQLKLGELRPVDLKRFRFACEMWNELSYNNRIQVMNSARDKRLRGCTPYQIVKDTFDPNGKFKKTSTLEDDSYTDTFEASDFQ